MKPSNKVKRWLDSYSSSNTRRNYGLALREFCKDYDVTPDQTLEWSEQEIENNLQDHINKLKKKSLAGSTVHIRLTALKMWFEFNRIDLPRRVIRQLSKGLKTGRERMTYIPTQDEVRQVLEAVGLKHKVMVSLIAFAGLRPVDIASLQYKHIKGSIESDDAVLTILKKHQKTNEWYFSLLGHQGTKYLKDYLKKRAEKHGVIESKDFILLNSRGKPFKSAGIRRALETAITKSIGKNPKSEIKTFIPYSFRKYFARAMTELGYEKREYLLGHRLSGTQVYDGLRDQDEQTLEKLKMEYIYLLPKLETEINEGILIKQQKDHETEVMKLRIEIGQIKDTLTKEILDTMFQKVDMGLFRMFFETPPELAHKALDDARQILERDAAKAQLTTKEAWETYPKSPVEGYQPDNE